MTRSWTFTDLEFAVVWEDHTGDGLPAPFDFTSRTPLLAEYEDERTAARDLLATTLDTDFEPVLTTLERPDVKVLAHGWDEIDFERPDRRVRVLGVRRGGHAFVVTQAPGETCLHGGEFTITAHDPSELAARVVGALPAAGAGTSTDIVVPTELSVEYSPAPGRSMVYDTDEESIERQSVEFFSRPADLAGAIRIGPGYSKFGPRGITERYVLWRDVTGDGRYAIVLDQTPRATGVDAPRLTALIDDEIYAVLERMSQAFEFDEEQSWPTR